VPNSFECLLSQAQSKPGAWNTEGLLSSDDGVHAREGRTKMLFEAHKKAKAHHISAPSPVIHTFLRQY